jgi:hypothetical protein
MVRRQARNGAWYHEPPYTWEESRDFYRAMSGGPVTVFTGRLLTQLRRERNRSAVNRRRNRRKNNARREALNPRRRYCTRWQLVPERRAQRPGPRLRGKRVTPGRERASIRGAGVVKTTRPPPCSAQQIDEALTLHSSARSSVSRNN